jgi:hypothetical protein
MPLYQNASVDKNKLIIGNYQMLVATYSSTTPATIASAVNIGAGIVNSFSHNITKYDVQAGNAPDPIEGIAEETFAVEGELIEYSVSSLSAIYQGVATGVTTLSFGGKTQLGEITVFLRNTTLGTSGASAISTSTIVRVAKATANTGLAFTAKSDNDTDPISVMAFSVLGKIDGTRAVGDQLYSITRTVGAA